MKRTSCVFWGILLMLLLTSCGGGQDEPRPTVDDPRAYAIEALQTMDLNTWWQAYRNTDPEFVGQIVDDVAAKQPDGLPTDASKLDLLINHQLAGSYKLRMDDTDEGRAFILAQAEARFANPPMALWDTNGKIALLDYYSLPGVWSSTSRISEGLKEPPAIETYPFLTPDVLANSLQNLVSAYPDAQTYQIRYQYHYGSELDKVLMQFTPDGLIVYREGGNLYFTPEPVGWDDLLNGRINLADLEWDSPMEGVDAPPIAYPPDEPLPME
ncbi:MAG: hypothetical protein R3D55_03195 [Chloroflexota bacterium]